MSAALRSLQPDPLEELAPSTGSPGAPWTYDNTGKLLSSPSLITTTSYSAAGQVGHIGYQNGDQYARALEKFLTDNPNASYQDRLVAKSLLDELRGVTKGQP
jgi:hypothetical protein